jgi:hypothetical protein
MIQFISPLGEEINEPNLNQVIDLVLKGEKIYWNSGSGDAGLTFHLEGKRTKLELVFEQEAGFHLLFLDENGKRFMAKGQGDSYRILTSYVGGNLTHIPEVFFISRKLTAVAVEHFYKTGKRTSAVNWVDQNDVDWKSSNNYL